MTLPTPDEIMAHVGGVRANGAYPDGPIRAAVAQLYEAAKQGLEDSARLDWLDDEATATQLRAIDARGNGTIRIAIDSFRTKRSGRAAKDGWSGPGEPTGEERERYLRGEE